MADQIFENYLKATEKLLKLRDGEIGKWQDFYWGKYRSELKLVTFPLTDEQLIKAAKRFDWNGFLHVIAPEDARNSFAGIRNQIANEYFEKQRVIKAPYWAVIEASAWRNPSCDPLRDEDKLETEYRRKHNLDWSFAHGKSLAQIAEELYGLEWVTAYKAIMDLSGGIFACDQYVQERYWELRGEGTPWHYYRRHVDRMKDWRESGMRGSMTYGFFREQLPALRAAVHASGVSTLTGKEKQNETI